ncbi:MAG: acylneuraminate cytidylyltransferase family protein [Candidatus Omnitrophica bacterium]|nr:acylneuraminate cytidylyltransferase family protein [Candidatus Omnitrophota bacterium]
MTTKPYILGAIFARGGSKTVPGKNIRDFAGKPLIAHAIECAKKVDLLDRVIVSTDDERIAEISRKAGADVPFMRPAYLASDDSPEVLSWKHAVTAMKEITGRDVDILVSIPATSPLRKPVDIENCVERLLASDADIVITVTRSKKSPFFNMVKIVDNGDATLVIPPAGKVLRRQESPEVFDITTVAYAVRVTERMFRMTSLFDLKVKTVEVPEERAMDIDTEEDLGIAEYLFKKRNG